MNRFPRKPSNLKPKKVIRIYTEGEKTEPNYFGAIKDELGLTQIDIQIHPTSRSTQSLVKYVMEEKDAESSNHKSTFETEWWVVFDRDDHEHFDRSIRLARDNGIQVAYSNECFELWFILHFEFLQTSLGRDAFAGKLTKHIGRKYEKNIDMYSLVKGREFDAMRNAKNLEKQYTKDGTESPLKRDPFTTVYLLVEQLRLLKINS
ncbi:MAG: RloB family protein [Candidatus Pacebacteria bacterium]|nr:RloB family protein [Candidatus Paceibacterota bacterium]